MFHLLVLSLQRARLVQLRWATDCSVHYLDLYFFIQPSPKYLLFLSSWVIEVVVRVFYMTHELDSSRREKISVGIGH